MAASTSAAAMMAAVLLLTTVTEAQGGSGSNAPSCASKLIPCANYISNASVTPPGSCCDPLKEAVKTELPCLCNLYSTPRLLASFGINVTQALGLSTRCGISADTSYCSKAITGAGAGSPAASPAPSPPPEAAGSNSGSRMAWSGLRSLGLIWAASSLF